MEQDQWDPGYFESADPILFLKEITSVGANPKGEELAALLTARSILPQHQAHPHPAP